VTKKAGIKALAVHFPRGVRTNQFFRNHHRQVVEAAESRKKGKMWAPSENHDEDDFDREMASYLADPFRGTVERRVLTEGETALTLEKRAAEKALAAAGMQATEIDLLIVASFLPDHFGAMNAAYLARDLGVLGMAFNMESACAGAMIGLHTACAMVEAGQYRNVMVVASCTYSRDTDTRDPISWTVGDGAGAFIVSDALPGTGRLGGKCIHTGDTCGALWFENYTREDGSLWFRLLADKQAGAKLRDTAQHYLKTCCEGALADAGLGIDDIDHFVFNTPLAWYSRFAARTLGVDGKRSVINMYPKYANIGPALLPANLYHAAREFDFKRGDKVLMYSVGSVSSAGAMVLTWGDVALGAPPDAPTQICD